ncbi:MAG: hypothetical protein EOM90_18465 [Alphaproteobacteria bacterium]|nr:hypothetical protein [Alphaproteobacteria bacterium]
MSATIWCTTGLRKGTDVGKGDIVSCCGKTMRDFFDQIGREDRTNRFFWYASAKVSVVRKILGISSHPEKDFLLNQIKNLKGRDEISVG